MLLLATCLGVLQPVPAFAWLYPEHRDMTGLAVQRLEPAPRALLEQLWSEARAGHEARLCAQLVDTAPGNPACIDYAAWPAIAGDHSCSARDLLRTVLDTPWILADNVSHLTAVISQGLEHGPPAPPAWVADLPLVGHRLHLAWQTLLHDTSHLPTTLQRLVVPVSTWLLRQGVTLDTGVRYLPGADLAGGRLHGGQGLDVGCARCPCCRARHRAEVNHGSRG